MPTDINSINKGLYSPSFEHDSCGIGFVASLNNKASHAIVENGLKILESMEHRGGCGCDINSGDGAGILIQKPHTFLKAKAQELNIELKDFEDYGVAQVFYPKDQKKQQGCYTIFKETIEKLGCRLIGSRPVKVDNATLGNMPLESEPYIEQVFIERSQKWDLDTFERKLYVIRNFASHRIKKEVKHIGDDFYIASCSYKTLIYKGQLTTAQVKSYFSDLSDERLITKVALVHSRFSTNTFPKWKLAQPFRYLAHNGEINTVKGNINWMKARQAVLACTLFTPEDFDMIFPVCDEHSSDSSNFDMVVEMMVLSGRSLPHVFMMLIPEAWQEYPEMEKHRRAFYEYHAQLMEPWDGPASVCFTDGHIVGASLDRNGLRPSRYCLLDNGMLVMASEAGVLDIDPSKVVKRGRLQPGKIFVADLEKGKIITDEELKTSITKRQSYGKWVETYQKNLDTIKHKAPKQQKTKELIDILCFQQAFGYSTEDINEVIAEIAKKGAEPIGSMGVDIALPILSEHPQHLSHYFKQLFAQVTNPPIDPIREHIIMSLNSYIGAFGNILEELPEHAKKIKLTQPILTEEELEKIKHIDEDAFSSACVDISMPSSTKNGTLEQAIHTLCQHAIEKVKLGNNILILTDKFINAKLAPIPALLATGAVHHALIREELRAKCSIIVETADARETHHFATLIGFGAHAICPYLAFNTIEKLHHENLIQTELNAQQLKNSFIKGICYGLRKILSKMGISTLQSYHGAQIFEILGIDNAVVDQCFYGTVSRIGGLDFDDIAKEILAKHRLAFPLRANSIAPLEVGGIYQWKRRGEYHVFNPQTVHLLQQSSRQNNYGIYKKYANAINNQSEKAATLRGLLTFTNQTPIALGEVEPVEHILKRFASGAMSFGSISHEAHTTLAIAMNRIGAKSNSGEGGEDPIRFFPKSNGDWERSAIKQVASGRFGVTNYYLTNADELQIKMAQGAKPGEGGQLPGHKVDSWIARVRHSTPGVGLISPPPHHDIYSIEDLAQLIFDLKNANREARISVKLVSEAGVGTVATGVTKAYADVVLIAGHDGGTGASPISSIRHAGLPWELGLAETHQTLIKNKLRNRVVVQADGQMKTGRDLAVATLLGAEEWGVATAALVVEGCILMRKCHLNTCPVGVATQNVELRKLFKGNPDHVVNFFQFLASDLREIMAELGFRTVNEMVGRSDKLKARSNLTYWKHKKINLNKILAQESTNDNALTSYCSEKQPHAIDEQIDHQIIALCKPALENQQPLKKEFKISNQNRTTGTMLSNEISKLYKDKGLAEDTIWLKFNGTSGQSFGAFVTPGLTMELEGESNDYFGKGLSGGKLILYAFSKSTYKANEQIIAGNVCLYGATSGQVFISGIVGERFCVRNSGATAVVEAVGDHGCEYMTGGLVIILGKTGRNFAAGMSGGITYVFDEDKKFKQRCNTSSIDFDPLEEEDIVKLKKWITLHYQYTKSEVASNMLNNWKQQANHFIKVMPKEYKKVLREQQRLQQAITSKNKTTTYG